MIAAHVFKNIFENVKMHMSKMTKKDLNNEIMILTLGGELLRLNFPEYKEDFVDPNFYFLNML